MPGLATLEAGIADLKSSVESISRQLGAWIRTLRDSDLKGERFVNAKVWHAESAAREREEFLARLERIRKGEDKAIHSRFRIQEPQTQEPRTQEPQILGG